MSEVVVWIHADCLNPQQAALRQHPGAPAVWVWDEALLRRRGLSLKRILFIYECLLELPVEIRRGQPVTELLAFAELHGANTVATMRSISPGFQRLHRSLGQHGLEFLIYESEPFVELPDDIDLRRFSRYWRVAQRALSRNR